MRRTLLAVGILIVASAAVGSDDLFRLSGWAAIPSLYRHPGPVSGQFAGPANGVTPPYQGQPIPGFSGMIPAATRGEYIALPDNGFGAQNNSADFVIGFYEVRARSSFGSTRLNFSVLGTGVQEQESHRSRHDGSVISHAVHRRRSVAPPRRSRPDARG